MTCSLKQNTTVYASLKRFTGGKVNSGNLGSTSPPKYFFKGWIWCHSSKSRSIVFIFVLE